MLTRLRRAWRRRTYKRGARLIRFVAVDVRREVEVIDDSELDAGFITVRMVTRNLLHERRLGGTTPAPIVRRVAIERLWNSDPG